MKTSSRVAVAVSAVAAVGALALVAASAPGAGTVVARYNPDAVAQVAGPRPDSAAAVAVVMEARNICQLVHGYAESPGPDRASAVLRSLDEATSAAAAVGRAEGQVVDVSEFAAFAADHIRQSEATGDVTPARRFVAGECDPAQDYRTPVLADEAVRAAGA